jgi:hypothetical protein
MITRTTVDCGRCELRFSQPIDSFGSLSPLARMWRLDRAHCLPCPEGVAIVSPGQRDPGSSSPLPTSAVRAATQAEGEELLLAHPPDLSGKCPPLVDQSFSEEFAIRDLSDEHCPSYQIAPDHLSSFPA